MPYWKLCSYKQDQLTNRNAAETTYVLIYCYSIGMHSHANNLSHAQYLFYIHTHTRDLLFRLRPRSRGTIDDMRMHGWTGEGLIHEHLAGVGLKE